MARKIMLAAVAIISDSAMVAVVLSAATVAISIAVHMKFKPFLSAPHTITLAEDGAMVHNGDPDDGFSNGDKLELLCLGTLLFVYLVGGLSAAINPQENSAGATIIGIIAILVLLFPFGGALVIHKQNQSSPGDPEEATSASSIELETKEGVEVGDSEEASD